MIKPKYTEKRLLLAKNRLKNNLYYVILPKRLQVLTHLAIKHLVTTAATAYYFSLFR